MGIMTRLTCVYVRTHQQNVAEEREKEGQGEAKAVMCVLPMCFGRDPHGLIAAYIKPTSWQVAATTTLKHQTSICRN